MTCVAVYVHNKITNIWLLVFLYNLLVCLKNQVKYISWILLKVTIGFFRSFIVCCIIFAINIAIDAHMGNN